MLVQQALYPRSHLPSPSFADLFFTSVVFCILPPLGSLSTLLVSQYVDVDSGLKPFISCGNAGVVSCAGEAEAKDPEGLFVGHPSLIGEFQDHGRPCLKRQGVQILLLRSDT